MGVALVTKCIMSYCQGNAVLVIHFTAKAVNQLYVTYVQDGALLCHAGSKAYKEDWPIV